MEATQPFVLLNTKKQKSLAGKTFLFALVVATLIFIPFIIQDGGRFILYGDFNVQQIPFYQLAHRAVRSGNIGWNWNTDLGANFFGSYTFYLLFSPFFWITLLFPNAAVPFLIAPLLILKTACAALTSYWYLERFVKDKYYAFFGSILYAFSGWMFYNVFFNHFHEAAVFFPLLLLGVEKLVTEDKKLFFGLMVALNAMVNYWFFVGSAVFVVLYVIVRCWSGGWGMTAKKFIQLAAEAVMGFLLAAVVVLPSVMALSGNPRTGSDRLISGIDFWIYWHNSSKYGDYPQRIPAILASLIFPPEITAHPNMFHLHGAQWSSMSAWLPMVSLSGVFAYFIQNRDKSTWLKRILGLCLFFALVPGLNSIFVLFNNSYYARWFYMPILLMSLATAIGLEHAEENKESIRKGIKWVLIPAVIFAIMCGGTPQKVDGKWSLGIGRDPALVWVWFLFVALGLLFVLLIYKSKMVREKCKKLLAAGLAVMIVVFGITYFATGRGTYQRSDEVINKALGLRGKFSLPEEEFYRSDIYDDMDNLLMYWGFPTIQAFHSVVPISIMEFYPEVGVKRNEGSRPETEYYALRSLLSVKYLFISEEKEEQSPMPNYSLFDTQNGYHIYENDAYIPMGFGYDSYITESEFKDGNISKRAKGNLLLRTLVLPDDLEEYPLPHLSKSQWKNLDKRSYLDDAKNRRNTTVENFTVTKKGFTATSNFKENEIIFFSVPFEKGWSAEVNGEPVDILKANIGFMAIPVPSGESEITFHYQTPGLKAGLLISGGMAVIFLIYGVVVRKKSKEEKEALDVMRQLQNGETVTLTWEEYLLNYSREQRRELIQQHLQEQQNKEIIQRIEEPKEITTEPSEE